MITSSTDENGCVDIRPVDVRILVPGAVVVEVGRLRASSPDVVAIEVSLHSKYAGVSGIGGGDDCAPNVALEATERTLRLSETAFRDEDTFIEFPEYIGWDVFAAEVAKSTLRVCLTRRV